MKKLKRLLIGLITAYWVSELFITQKLELQDGIITLEFLLFIFVLEIIDKD